MAVFLSLILAVRPYVTVYYNAINSAVPALLVYVTAQLPAQAQYTIPSSASFFKCPVNIKTRPTATKLLKYKLQ
jgi:hypothetical protein